jgi:ABC-type arginine/histidine transport system permease subunit
MYSLLLGLFYLFLGFSAYRKFRDKWINDKIGNAVFFIAISLIVSSYSIVIILGAVPSSR